MTSRRDELLRRMSDSSREEVIREEMIRTGFWKEGDGATAVSDALLKRQAEIRDELGGLASDVATFHDPERALKLIRIERMKEAREKRLETKQRRAKERHDRAMAWHQRQGRDVTHLGDGVSAALVGTEGKPERVAALKLPAIADPAALAQAMGIKIGELRFLAYNRRVAKVDHYQRFTIPKKSGGVREISAPMPRLKRAQYWILGNVLAPLAAHDAAHGFRSGRSIMTNAGPHAGRRVVVNIDLKDFFPTITYGRVKGFFVNLGYPEKVAAPLALICTDAERDKMRIDNVTWSVAREGRRLPQGAPTSPAIANIIANRLDKRMTGAARKYGFTYTRYADDMTFSGDPAPGSNAVNRLLWQLRLIAEDEGFTFNDRKTRVMGAGSRQDVTGLVVNRRPAVARTERRRFRAWLHRAEAAKVTGGEPPQWTNAKGAQSDALGFASYLAMVDREHGPEIVARTKAALGIGRPAAKSGPGTKAAFRLASTEGKAPREKWWQPADRLPPKLEVFEQRQPGQPRSQAAAETSVPATGRASGAGSAGAAQSRGTQQGSNQRQHRQSEGRAPSPSPMTIKAAMIRTVLLIPLLLIPYAGPLLFLIGLWVVWRKYLAERG